MTISDYHKKMNYKNLSVIEDKFHGWCVKSRYGVVTVFDTKLKCDEWAQEYLRESIFHDAEGRN